MEPITIHDLTAAYALDALDPEDERAYEEHLARCERCRAELSALAQTATALAYAVDAPPPPPALRDRIVAAATSERERVVPLRPRWAVPAAALAAAAAAAAIGVGVWAASLQSELSSASRASADRVVSMLATPGAVSLSLSSRRGALVVVPDGRAALVTGLGPAPAGMTYEAWVIEPGASPRPAGLFPGGGTVVLDVPVRAGSIVAVTVEPWAGSPAPTAAPIAQSRPV